MKNPDAIAKCDKALRRLLPEGETAAEDVPVGWAGTTPSAPRLIRGQPWTSASVWGRLHFELLTGIAPDRQDVIDALCTCWHQHPQSAPPELVKLYLAKLVRNAPGKRGRKRTMSQASKEHGYAQLIDLVHADGGSIDDAIGTVSDATGTPSDTVRDYWRRREKL